PKVSPLRGMPVDQWVATKADGWRAQVVNKLLSLSRKTLPEATIAIKWAQPIVELNGPLAFIKVAKGHVTFGFWRGADLTDPARRLEGGTRMRHVKITGLADYDEKAFVAYLKQAATLNRLQGSPTQR